MVEPLLCCSSSFLRDSGASSRARVATASFAELSADLVCDRRDVTGTIGCGSIGKGVCGTAMIRMTSNEEAVLSTSVCVGEKREGKKKE